MDTNNENGKLPESVKGSVVEKKIPKPFGRNDARTNNATNKFFGNNKTGATFKSNGFDRRNTNTKKGR